jgi:DNA gyrase/topoisomerase IV subunit B
MTETSTPDRLDITGYVVRALALYSLEEFQAGHASSIYVSANGASFTVADDGRGHAIDRTVAGSPYLPFIYTHLDYPFSPIASGPIQLQGIGMSLINALCSELSVTVHKAAGTLRMTYNDGKLCHEERTNVATEASGNAVTGTISPRLQQAGANVANIEKWLLSVMSANPLLKMYFNGKELRAPQPNAA